MKYDVLLLSPWTNPIHVNPSYQLIRNELSGCSALLANERIHRFLGRHSDRSTEYTEMVRYQHQFPYCPGLLSIAAVLEREGFTVRCVSLDVEKSRDPDPNWLMNTIARHCQQTGIAVGVTAVTPEYERAVQILELVKQCSPQLKRIIGGTHVTYLDEDAALHPAVDVVVRGEGELTVLELIRRWSLGESVRDVLGVTFRQNDATVRNPPRPLMDLRELPTPAYHLLDAETRRLVHLTPTYSRGCPFACNYCLESTFWERRVRHKDPVRFADELQLITETMNWRFIHIADSTFGLDRGAIVALCDELERRGLDALFSVNVRPDVFAYLGEDLIRRLLSLNFVEFCLGAETADDVLVQALRRKQHYHELLETLHRLKALNVPFVKLYLMVGVPGDSHESLQKTVNAVRMLVEQDLVYYATAKFFVPTPGTELFNNLQQNGSQLPATWSLYERYNFPPVYTHSELSMFELEQYLCLIQAVQLAVYRRRLGVDSEERQRIRRWVDETYLKRIYL